MKTIANNDLQAIVRYLTAYSKEAPKGGSTREVNERRLAGVLARKLSRKL